MSIGLVNWREVGASMILACLNTLVALALICLGLFLVIAVSILARRASNRTEGLLIRDPTQEARQ